MMVEGGGPGSIVTISSVGDPLAHTGSRAPRHIRSDCGARDDTAGILRYALKSQGGHADSKRRASSLPTRA